MYILIGQENIFRLSEMTFSAKNSTVEGKNTNTHQSRKKQVMERPEKQKIHGFANFHVLNVDRKIKCKIQLEIVT